MTNWALDAETSSSNTIASSNVIAYKDGSLRSITLHVALVWLVSLKASLTQAPQTKLAVTASIEGICIIFSKGIRLSRLQLFF